MLAIIHILLSLSATSTLVNAQYTATYLPSNAPDKTEGNQIGTNKCGTGSSQSSMCQNVYINNAEDFCVWAPPSPGANSAIGQTEQIEVAWCTKSGYGTRLIPDGTLQGVHFVQTPDYVQITGWGDFTKTNIPAGDEGGELDPHGADGLGNPHGGLVFSSAFGSLQQLHEWTNFMSATEFCIRGCKDGPKAAALCMHIYDVMGCNWNMPGNYDQGVFENCVGDSAEPMGVYGTSTFRQGDPSTPAAHPVPSSSKCANVASISNGGAAVTESTSTAVQTSVVVTTSIASLSTVTVSTSISVASSLSAGVSASQSVSSVSHSGVPASSTLTSLTRPGSVTVTTSTSGSTSTSTSNGARAKYGTTSYALPAFLFGLICIMF